MVFLWFLLASYAVHVAEAQAATPADWNVWLGLSDSSWHGFYTWSDSQEMTFTNWAPGQPNSTTKSCVMVLHETGQWVVSPCTDLNAYTCKIAKGHHPPPPAATEVTCPAIDANGAFFDLLEHHMPFSLVDKLEVSGDMEVFSVTSCHSQLEPYLSNIVRGLSPVMEVTIRGTILPGANRFEVSFRYASGAALLYMLRFDLKCGDSEEQPEQLVEC